ncbi:MAG: hypothetical protein WC756_12965 [Taibaiella sp.]|jgi:hypothetical protein
MIYKIIRATRNNRLKDNKLDMFAQGHRLPSLNQSRSMVKGAISIVLG